MTEEVLKAQLEAFEGMSLEELCGTAEAWGVADKAKAAIIQVLLDSDIYKEGMAQVGCEKEV